MHHFRNDTENKKVSFDNFPSAQVQCNKYNSNINNLGKIKLVPYKCKICNKVHIGKDIRKKIITFEVRESALEKVNKLLSNTILIKKISI